MNKKHFLFLLPVCLLFCISLTTCEEEVVTDLWEKLRNTAWSGTSYYEADYGRFSIETTIGFYGSNNGPIPQRYFMGDAGFYPYFIIRQFYSFLDSEEQHDTCYFYYASFQIDRTGNKISNIYWSSNIYMYPFSISVSDNGEKLTLREDNKYSGLGHACYFSGTYSKISSDPKYKYYDDEKFFGTYISQYETNGKVITETVQINETNFRIEDNDPAGRASLYFEITDWDPPLTPSMYMSRSHPEYFEITGRITSANPQHNDPNDPKYSYLYGNKTAPGFTAADINSTECRIVLHYDNDGKELIRSNFFKIKNGGFEIVTDNNMDRIYRRYD